jgi:coatomer subunit beta
MACKRNAFVMLCNCAPELAVEYLESVLGQVPNFDELLQMAVVDLIRKDCRNNAANKVLHLTLHLRVPVLWILLPGY